MNLYEAESFYKQYLGNTFRMAHEDESTYRIFKELCRDDDILKQWDAGLIEESLENMNPSCENSWKHLECIFHIISRGKCSIQTYAERILGKLAEMAECDGEVLVKIIEIMTGRDCMLEEGGIRLFLKDTDLQDEMMEVMDLLVESAEEKCGNDDVTLQRSEEHYLTALRLYRKKYRK